MFSHKFQELGGDRIALALEEFRLSTQQLKRDFVP